MQKLFYVGIGGCLGAVLRYIITINSSKMQISQIPWGTLIVNVTGGFLIGLVVELCLTTERISPNMRLFLTTGILGGFTTFSTFSFETVELFSKGMVLAAALNICLNLFLSLGGVLLGQYFVKAL